MATDVANLEAECLLGHGHDKRGHTLSIQEDLDTRVDRSQLTISSSAESTESSRSLFGPPVACARAIAAGTRMGLIGS